MSKFTAHTTLSFNGQVLARGGKQFDGNKLPAKVLKQWMGKGLCSPIPSRGTPRKTGKASSQAKSADTTIKENKDGSERK